MALQTERKNAEKLKKPILGIIFAFSLIVPVSFYAGPLRLPPNMILLVLVFVPVFFSWVSGKAGRKLPVDYLILAASLWAALAVLLSDGLSNTVEPAGVAILQTLGAYLLGRTSVTNTDGLRTIVRVYLIMLTILLPFAFYETLTERTLYLDMFRPFGVVYPNLEIEPRGGLERVQAAFEHPILYGVFSASGFALVWYSLKKNGTTVFSLYGGLVSVVSSILSVSTGAVLGIATQILIIGWGWIFRNQPNRWRNLGILVILMYVSIDAVSNRSPFHVFVDYLTFNSGSAYNRILIWQYGTAQLFKVPFFGMGVHAPDWERAPFMSSSMDNFWLVVAVSYGIPGFLFLAGAMIWLLFKIGSRRELDQRTENLRIGLVISLIGLFTAIASVHLWNSSYCWMMFLVGSSVCLLNEGRDKREIQIEKAAKQREAQENEMREARKRRSMRQSL